jgi:hypothetical protein
MKCRMGPMEPLVELEIILLCKIGLELKLEYAISYVNDKKQFKYSPGKIQRTKKNCTELDKQLRVFAETIYLFYIRSNNAKISILCPGRHIFYIMQICSRFYRASLKIIFSFS